MPTHRIGLFTPRKRRKKGQTSTVTTYVEIATPAELAAKVVALGGAKTGLISRDRAGNTQVQGKMFTPGELNDKHLTWLTAKSEEFETRGLFFE
jgi:hypothetical protein